MPKFRHPHNRKKPKPHKPAEVPFATRLVDDNGSFSLVVDGTTPIDFGFVPDDDVVCTELSLLFEDNGQFKYGDNFLSVGALANGIEIEIQSYGRVLSATFHTTRDLVEYASPGGFWTDSGGGRSIVKATRRFSEGVRLRDRYADYIKLTVSDNLTAMPYGIASVLGYSD